MPLKKVKGQPTISIWINLADLETAMLYTKIQPQSFPGSREEDLQMFLPYMGMATILFNSAEPFEQTGKTFSTEGPMWNLVKIVQAVSEKKTFKKYTILYMYIALGKGI